MRKNWKELDLLRGIAACCMLVNHAGVSWYPKTSELTPAIDLLVFIGSFAPVLFFLSTGIGYGVQSTRRQASIHSYGFVRKVLILVAADFMMRWEGDRFIGLNFLGFIALCMLVLEWVRASRNPPLATTCLLITSVFLRFGLGTRFALSFFPPETSNLLGSLLGQKAIEGVAYPPFPWIAYCLIGFLIGHFAQARQSTLASSPARFLWILTIIGGSFATISWGLVKSGSALFRWGTMSVSFFALSIAVVACTVSFCLLACRPHVLDRFVSTISIRGVSSLAFVPIHYIIVALFPRFLSTSDRTVSFLLSVTLATLIALWVAKAFGRTVTSLDGSNFARNGQKFLVAICLGCAALLLIPDVVVFPASRFAISSLGQLVLCALLVL